MAIQSLLVILFLPLLSSAYEASKHLKEFTVIEGKVYCQSCEHIGSWSLEGAKSLASAKVGIACKDYKKRIWFYKSFEADKNGYYYAPIPEMDGTEGVRKKEISGCSIHLLDSPDSACNLLTNINFGIAGAGVGERKKAVKEKGYEVVVYAAPPLAFKPVNCVPLGH
ncbi:uncharacterized protein LOC110026563 [Phalaenopsis equestris]|uniref:uncharacterized protein LOC110026563 n=1 Tax=Phalaenopsis equestris TaxID=78828 RepID=UPI0009E3A9FA|nr:uncharacterized protein LOC110026563 [Phalaenopsis equestris]